MTKFFTDSKKRIRPLSHRQPSTQTYQKGVAHLNVPKRISKQKTVTRVFYDDRDAMRTAMKVLSNKSPNTDITETMADQLNWLDVDKISNSL